MIEITSAWTFRLRTNAGDVVNVSLPNVGEQVAPEAMTMLQRMIGGKRVSVMLNPSADAKKDIAGEVHEEQARDISRQSGGKGAGPSRK